MSDDRLRELFGQVASMAVQVPPADRAADRGRRRRRARLRAATLAWTAVLAGGVGAPEAAGSMAGMPSSQLHIAKSAALRAPLAAAPTFGSDYRDSARMHMLQAAGYVSAPAHGTAGSGGAMTTSDQARALLPPPGRGQLLLGLDTAGEFVMTRIGSATAPVRVPGIEAAADAPPVLVTDPAGGWVVVISSPERSRRARTTRLAVVAATGKSEPFGPVFFAQTVTSAAVDPGGSRVAVALYRPLARSRIEVVPLPGHRGADRFWRLRSVRANVVTSLSWAPDGRHVSYLAVPSRAADPPADGPVMLDVAKPAAAGPTRSGWPPAAMPRTGCVPDVTAWLGKSGRFAALEHCAGQGTEVFQPADARTGAAAGPAVVVSRPRSRRCDTGALDPDAAGSRVLISYCGIYLVRGGRLTKVPVGLTAAALSG
jgi:hypothetical protein